MATGSPVGRMYVTLDMDASAYKKAQAEIFADAGTRTDTINKIFKTVGTQSDAMYNAMRSNIQTSLNAIKESHISTANDIRRAQESAAEKIAAIDAQQFGKKTSFIDGLKQNWLAASAAIVGAWALVNKAVEFMDEGAAAMRIESSFKIMAEAAGDSSERIVASMKAATKETIDDSDLMQKATKLMTLGFNPEQIERFSGVVITASQIAGVTAVEAFDKLGDAIGNRTPKALMQLGAVTKDQMDTVNEAISAGATTIDVYALAMANLEYKQKMLQGTQDEASIALQKFHTQVGELKENIGKGLIVVVDIAYRAFQALAAGVLYAFGGLSKFEALVQKYVGTAEKQKEAMDNANIAWAAADDLIKQASKSITEENKIETRATKEELAGAKDKVDARLKDLASLKIIAEQKKKDEEAAKKYASEEEKRIAQIEKDRIAEIKLIEKVGMAQIEAYGDYEDMNNDRSKLDAKRTNDLAKENDKQIKDEEKKAADLQGIYRQLYDDLDEITQESFDFKVDLLDKEAAANIAAGASMELVMAAYEARWKTLHDELVLSNGTFVDGVMLGLDRVSDKLVSWAGAGLALFESFRANTQTTLQGFISDVLTGDIRTFKDYWKTFQKDMIDDFSEWMGRWVTTYAESQLKKLLTDTSTQDTLIGAIKFFADIASKVFDFLGGSGSTIYEGIKTVFEQFHTGGVVGEGGGELAGRNIFSLNSDEIVAVLEKGEAVLTKDQVSVLRQILGTYEIAGTFLGVGPGGDQSGVVGPAQASSATVAAIIGALSKGITGNILGMVKGIAYAAYISTQDFPQLDTFTNFIGSQIFGYDINDMNAEAQGLASAAAANAAMASTAAYGAAGGWGVSADAGSPPGVGEGGDSMGYASGGIVSTTGKALVHAGEGVFTPAQMKQLNTGANSDTMEMLIAREGEVIKAIKENGAAQVKIMTDIRTEYETTGQVSDASQKLLTTLTERGNYLKDVKDEVSALRIDMKAALAPGSGIEGPGGTPHILPHPPTPYPTTIGEPAYVPYVPVVTPPGGTPSVTDQVIKLTYGDLQKLVYEGADRITKMMKTMIERPTFIYLNGKEIALSVIKSVEQGDVYWKGEGNWNTYYLKENPSL